eukprot:8649467-Pyramimonas_sp.AAC.2
MMVMYVRRYGSLLVVMTLIPPHAAMQLQLPGAPPPATGHEVHVDQGAMRGQSDFTPADSHVSLFPPHWGGHLHG